MLKALAFSESRIITPPVDAALTLNTRATIVPSPVIGWYSRLIPSADPHADVPAPFTVNVPFA